MFAEIKHFIIINLDERVFNYSFTFKQNFIGNLRSKLDSGTNDEKNLFTLIK